MLFLFFPLLFLFVRWSFASENLPDPDSTGGLTPIQEMSLASEKSTLSLYFDCQSSLPSRNGSKEAPFKDFRDLQTKQLNSSELIFFLLNENCSYRVPTLNQTFCNSLQVIGSDNDLSIMSSLALSPVQPNSPFALTLENITLLFQRKAEVKYAWFNVSNDRRSSLSLKNVTFFDLPNIGQPVFFMSFQNVSLNSAKFINTNAQILKWSAIHGWPTFLELNDLLYSECISNGGNSIWVDSVQSAIIQNIYFKNAMIENSNYLYFFHFSPFIDESNNTSGTSLILSNLILENANVSSFLFTLYFDSVVLENITVSNSSLTDIFNIGAIQDILIANLNIFGNSTLKESFLQIGVTNQRHFEPTQTPNDPFPLLKVANVSTKDTLLSYSSSIFKIQQVNQAIFTDISIVDSAFENDELLGLGGFIELNESQNATLFNFTVLRNRYATQKRKGMLWCLFSNVFWVNVTGVSASENKELDAISVNEAPCFFGFIIQEVANAFFDDFSVENNQICQSFLASVDVLSNKGNISISNFSLQQNNLSSIALSATNSLAGLLSFNGNPQVQIDQLICNQNTHKTDVSKLGKSESTAVCINVQTIQMVSIQNSVFKQNFVEVHLRKLGEPIKEMIETPEVHNALVIDAGRILLNNSIWEQNSAHIYQSRGTSGYFLIVESLEVINSTFVENWGFDCPSLYVQGEHNVSVRVQNSNFSRNTGFLPQTGNALCYDGFGDVLIEIFNSTFEADLNEELEESNYYLKVASQMSEIDMLVHENCEFDIMNQNVLLLDLPSNYFNVTFEGNTFSQEEGPSETPNWVNNVFAIETFDDTSLLNFNLEYKAREESLWDISSWGSLNLVDNIFENVQAGSLVYTEIYPVNFTSNHFTNSHLEYFVQGTFTKLFWSNNTVSNANFVKLFHGFSRPYFSWISSDVYFGQNVSLYLEDSSFENIQYRTLFNVSNSQIEIRRSNFTNFTAGYASFFATFNSSVVFSSNKMENGGAWIGAIGFVFGTNLFFSDNTYSNMSALSGCLISIYSHLHLGGSGLNGSNHSACLSYVTPNFSNFIYTGSGNGLKLRRAVISESSEKEKNQQLTCEIDNWNNLLKNKEKPANVQNINEVVRESCNYVTYTALEENQSDSIDNVGVTPGLSLDFNVVMVVVDSSDKNAFYPLLINLVTMEDIVCTVNASIASQEGDGVTEETLNVNLAPHETYFNLSLFTKNATKWVNDDTGSQVSMQPVINITLGISISNSSLFFKLYRQTCPLGFSYEDALLFGYPSPYRYCFKCPDESYSIPDQETPCTACPDFSTCTDGRLYLPKGQWRYNNDSKKFFFCKNQNSCFAEATKLGSDENSFNMSFFNNSEFPLSFPIFESKFCDKKNGYIGPLCLGCDLFNITGQGRFYSSDLGYCSKCSGSKLEIWAMIIFFGAYQFSLIFIVIIMQKLSTTNPQKKKKVLSISLIKMILIFYQILQNITNISAFPGTVITSKYTVISKTLKALKSLLSFCFSLRSSFFYFTSFFSCLVDDPGPYDIQVVLRNQVAYYLIYSLICFVFIIVVNLLWVKRSHLWYHILGDFLVFYTVMAPYIAGFSMRAVSSILIYSQETEQSMEKISVNMAMVLLENDNPHLVFPRVVMIISALLVFLVPLVAWGHMIYLKKRETKKKKELYFSITYLFLVGDYRKNAFDYEIIRIYLIRVIVTAICNNILWLDQFKIMVLAFIFLVYILFNSIKSPFNSRILNNFDFYLGFFVIAALSLLNFTFIEENFIPKNELGNTKGMNSLSVLLFVFLVIYLVMIGAMMVVWLYYLFDLVRNDYKEYKNKQLEKKYLGVTSKPEFTQSLLEGGLKEDKKSQPSVIFDPSDRKIEY